MRRSCKIRKVTIGTDFQKEDKDMLNAMGHEQATVYGGKRDSKQETIQEHAAKIIAGHDNNQIKEDKKKS